MQDNARTAMIRTAPGKMHVLTTVDSPTAYHAMLPMLLQTIILVRAQTAMTRTAHGRMHVSTMVDSATALHAMLAGHLEITTPGNAQTAIIRAAGRVRYLIILDIPIVHPAIPGRRPQIITHTNVRCAIIHLHGVGRASTTAVVIPTANPVTRKIDRGIMIRGNALTATTPTGGEMAGTDFH
jgi:hypothetical protein